MARVFSKYSAPSYFATTVYAAKHSSETLGKRGVARMCNGLGRFQIRAEEIGVGHLIYTCNSGMRVVSFITIGLMRSIQIEKFH